MEELEMCAIAEMRAEKLCGDCGWWVRDKTYYLGMYKGGTCTSDKLNECCEPLAYTEDSLTYSYAESGSFWTGPKFGCVHWKAKE